MCNPTDTGANVVVAAVLKNLPVQKHAFIGLQLPLIKQTILNRHQAANAARSCCDCNPSDGEERLHRRKTISNGNWRLRFSKQSYLLVRVQKIQNCMKNAVHAFFQCRRTLLPLATPWTLNKRISCFKTLKLPPRRIRQLNHQLRFCLQQSHFGTPANKATRACSKSCQTAS